MSLDKLLPSEMPLFDREQLLRQVLFAKVSEWLKCGKFYCHTLLEIREIVQDLAGVAKQRNDREDVPPDLMRVDYVSFSALSQVNLRECIEAALKYTGITERTGNDLFGAEAWLDVQAQVERTWRSGTPDKPASSPYELAGGAKVQATAPWATAFVREIVATLLAGRFFDITAFDKARTALETFSETSGIALVRPSAYDRHYAALRTQHCAHFDEMSTATIEAMPGAIMSTLGLDAANTDFLLGPGAHAEIVAALGARQASPSGEQQPETPSAVVHPRAWWRRVLR